MKYIFIYYYIYLIFINISLIVLYVFEIVISLKKFKQLNSALIHFYFLYFNNYFLFTVSCQRSNFHLVFKIVSDLNCSALFDCSCQVLSCRNPHVSEFICSASLQSVRQMLVHRKGTFISPK